MGVRLVCVLAIEGAALVVLSPQQVAMLLIRALPGFKRIPEVLLRLLPVMPPFGAPPVYTGVFPTPNPVVQTHLLFSSLAPL